jgi:hypothetical protein
LGPLLSVKAALYMGRTRRIRDVLWHDGTHLADAIMFLTGGILLHKKCFGSPLSSREGTAFLSGYLKPVGKDRKSTGRGPWGQKAPPASVPFLIEAGAGRDHLVFGMEFSCAGGRLRIGNGVFEVWESGPSPYAEKFMSLKKTREGFEGPTGYFANMVADAVACVRNPARRPRSGADDGFRVIEYLHSVG